MITMRTIIFSCGIALINSFAAAAELQKHGSAAELAQQIENQIQEFKAEETDDTIVIAKNKLPADKRVMITTSKGVFFLFPKDALERIQADFRKYGIGLGLYSLASTAIAIYYYYQSARHQANAAFLMPVKSR